MEEKVNFLDKLIKNITEYMNNPKVSFVFGGVFFLGFFYLITYRKVVSNLEQTIAVSQRDIDFWKNKSEENEKSCKEKIYELEQREKRIQDEAFENLIKTNSFLKDLKSDKASDVDLTKKVADYQKKILK